MTTAVIKAPLQDFDWSVLNRLDFGEDAVREEIIAPILWALGYRVTPPNRIVRSPRLEHPFVAMGTTKHPISLVPDYLMHVSERPAWILDAKSPRENLLNPSHEAQAYSYAIHRDVRTQWYAICNGREFAAFNVGDMSQSPRFRFPLTELRQHWGLLLRTLGPNALLNSDFRLVKDFGIQLLKMGFDTQNSIPFPDVPVSMVGRVDEYVYTMMAKVRLDDREYIATFDFDVERWNELLKLVPALLAKNSVQNFAEYPFLIEEVASPRPRVFIQAKLGGKILENNEEHYLPLCVEEFS